MQNRKPTEEARNTTVNIRVSESEKAELRKLAAKYDISVGAYLLTLALNPQSLQNFASST